MRWLLYLFNTDSSSNGCAIEAALDPVLSILCRGNTRSPAIVSRKQTESLCSPASTLPRYINQPLEDGDIVQQTLKLTTLSGGRTMHYATQAERCRFGATSSNQWSGSHSQQVAWVLWHGKLEYSSIPLRELRTFRSLYNVTGAYHSAVMVVLCDGANTRTVSSCITHNAKYIKLNHRYLIKYFANHLDVIDSSCMRFVVE